jgi:hypothetical protein
MRNRIAAVLTFIFSSFFMNAQETVLTNRQINEQIFFAPELEAYKYGRRTDGNGVGKSWFHRFGILHISDVHQRNENLLEAIEVASGRVYFFNGAIKGYDLIS